MTERSGNVPVRRTSKLFVGGKFVRSESGRSYRPGAAPQVNIPRSSRKDLRDAVQAARKGLVSWRDAGAQLRGQILYRLAEMLEGRKDALVAELENAGATGAAAKAELEAAIALCVWYAGLCDKLQCLLGSQNDVAGPFFNFSAVEPCGVIAVLAPEQPALLGLLALLLPVLCGGNSAVVLCSESAPLPALAFAEAIATSDLPAGTVNVMSGLRSELAPQLAAHRDIDGLLAAGAPDKALGEAAAGSCKRVRWCELPAAAWRKAGQLRSLLWVEPFVEVKTIWHPVAP